MNRMLRALLAAALMLAPSVQAKPNRLDVGPAVSGTPLLQMLYRDELDSFFASPQEPTPRRELEGVPVGGWNTFYSLDVTQNAPFQVRAQLRHIGEHCYIYVQEGHELSDETAQRLAYQFDENIYPTSHDYFGSEPSPGIDWDPRVTLLLMDIQDGWTPGKGYVAGYFFPLDNASTRLFDFSNERQIFYMDVYPGDPESEGFLGVLAHEFQHMIHSNYDPREALWLNEAMSQVAFYVNGYGHAPQIFRFSDNSDTALVEFDNSLDDYGSVYLWSYYCTTKYGGSTPAEQAAFTKALVQGEAKSMAAFDEVLAAHGGPSAAEVFQDWVIANYANDLSLNDGKYGYDETLRFAVKPSATHGLGGSTGKVEAEVFPWAADYVTFLTEELYKPLNPTMVDRVLLLAKGDASEISWTINGGQLPPESIRPAGSRVENGRVYTPVADHDGGRGALVGHFARRGVQVDSVEFFNGQASVSTPVLSLPAMTQGVAVGADKGGSFDIRFGYKDDEITVRAILKKGAATEVVDVDKRFRLDTLAGVDSVTFAISGNPVEKDKKAKKAKKYWYRARGSLAEGADLKLAARLRGLEDAVVELASTGDADAAAALAGLSAARRQAEQRVAARMLASADDSMALAGAAFGVEGRTQSRMIASAKAALRMARFQALEAARAKGVDVDQLLAEEAAEAAATDELAAGAAALMGDDQDDAHTNLGYLLFKAGEPVHSLDHLKIDPLLIEGQILKLWRLLEIARGFPHLPIPDGLNIRDYDLQGTRGVMQGWANHYGVDWDGGADAIAPSGDVELAKVKATLRRLRLAAEIIELSYDNSIIMADDLTSSVYDFARLILHGWQTSQDIAKVFEAIPVVGKAVKYIKSIIHRKLVRLVEIIAQRLSVHLKAPYNQYAPMVITAIAWAYSKFMGLPNDPNDPRFAGRYEFGVKLLGRFALTATPRLGYIDRGQDNVDLMQAYAADLTAEGTLEQAHRAVMDDQSSQTEGSVREQIFAEIGARHGTFVRNRKILDITRRVLTIGQYASAIDPTNISKIVTVVAAAASTGLIGHSAWRAGSMYFKMQDQFVEGGVRLAFDPGLGNAAFAPEAVGPQVRMSTAFAGEAMAQLESNYESFERALRVAREAAGYRMDALKRGGKSKADVDQRFLAAAEALDAADRELEASMSTVLTLAFNAEAGDVEAGLTAAASNEVGLRADAMAKLLARGLGSGPQVLDPDFEARRLEAARMLVSSLHNSLAALRTAGTMDAQVTITKTKVKALGDGRFRVQARVSNPGDKTLEGVRVSLQSALHFAIEGDAVVEVGSLRRGRSANVQFVLDVPAEDLTRMPLVSVVPEATDAKGVSGLALLQ